MCQASKCGLPHAAGRYGDTPTRCNSDLRARSSLTHTAFPRLDESDQFTFSVSSTPLTADASTQTPFGEAPSVIPRLPSFLAEHRPRTDRPVLFSLAIYTSTASLPSHGAAGPASPRQLPFARASHRTTAVAPEIVEQATDVRAAPCFDVRAASACRQSCRGTESDRARQAESRPRLKVAVGRRKGLDRRRGDSTRSPACPGRGSNVSSSLSSAPRASCRVETTSTSRHGI